jgi:hypothetical protein
LRLIKRVRTSVVALVPPSRGIRATLLANGVSRVVLGGDTFPTTIVRRSPELVALTSPVGATGLFDLDPQSDMLLPFEGMGVDTSWEFQMPRAANPFDFNTIADVQLTVEYTALQSFDYRRRVIDTLNPTVSSERAFSLRDQFSDQWYALNNPDPGLTTSAVRLCVLPGDFPPNLDDLRVEQVTLYFVRAPGSTSEVPVTYLTLSSQTGGPPVGGSARSTDSVVSTRRGNGSAWMGMVGRSPIGLWDLALPASPDMVDLLHQGKIEDIVLAVSFSGRSPAWPS